MTVSLSPLHRPGDEEMASSHSSSNLSIIENRAATSLVLISIDDLVQLTS